jgi:N-acetylneuraminate synthase/sialic acid synthase
MRKLVRDLHRIRTAVGDGVKRRYESEERPLEKMGKKLVVARDLPGGHELGPDDVAIKSPAGGGLPPYEYDNVVGRRLARSLAADQGITLLDLEAEPAETLAAEAP